MHAHRFFLLLASSVLTHSFAADKPSSPKAVDHQPSDGPGITVNPHPHERGDATAGKTVFRFETLVTRASAARR